MVQGRRKKRRFSLLRIFSCVSTDESREQHQHSTTEKLTSTSSKKECEDRLSTSSSLRSITGSVDDSPSNKSATFTSLFRRRKNEEGSNRVMYSESGSEAEGDSEEPVFIERSPAGEPEIKTYKPGQAVPKPEIHIDEPVSRGNTERKSSSDSDQKVIPQEKSAPKSQEKSTHKAHEKVAPRNKSESGKDDADAVKFLEPKVKPTISISCHDLRTSKRICNAEEIMKKYNIKPRKSNSGEHNSTLHVPGADKSKSGTNGLHVKSAAELFTSNKSVNSTAKSPSTDKMTQLQLDMRERGEKVSLLDDSSQQLKTKLSALSKSTSHLAEAYKNKKWWQF